MTKLTAILSVLIFFLSFSGYGASPELEKFYAGPLRAPDLPTTIGFYESLLDQIDTAGGSFFIELHPSIRRWTTHVDNTRDIELIVNPNLTAPSIPPKIQVFFQYKDGNLQRGEGETRPHIIFSPPITFSQIPAIAQSPVISKIYFNENGIPVEFRSSTNGDITDILGSWNLLGGNFYKHMQLPATARDLFQKGPFRWSAAPIVAGETGLLLTRIYFPAPEDQAENPGIAVRLKENGLIKPSINNDSYFKPARQNQLKILSFSYDFLTRVLDGRISSLDVTLHSGRLANRGLDLNLGEGNRVRFDRVDFHDSSSTDGRSSVEFLNGSVTGDISTGSMMALSGDNSEASFSADVGSSVDLNGVNLRLTTNTAVFNVGEGSSVSLKLIGARVPLIDRDHVVIKQGNIHAELSSAVWQNGTGPAAAGTLKLLTGDIQSGVFSLVAGNGVNLDGGSIRGADLRFDSAASRVLTGSFQEVIFEVEDGATIELPGRFIAVSRAGTRLAANTSNNPFSIRAGTSTATGSFRAIIPFWTCFTPPAGSPVIKDSMMRSTIVLTGTGLPGGSDEIVDYTCCPR
jgi:hypothetical protein